MFRHHRSGLLHQDCIGFDKLVGDWLKKIQLRVPGAVVVGTHLSPPSLKYLYPQSSPVKSFGRQIPSNLSFLSVDSLHDTIPLLPPLNLSILTHPKASSLFLDPPSVICTHAHVPGMRKSAVRGLNYQTQKVTELVKSVLNRERATLAHRIAEVKKTIATSVAAGGPSLFFVGLVDHPFAWGFFGSEDYFAGDSTAQVELLNRLGMTSPIRVAPATGCQCAVLGAL